MNNRHPWQLKKNQNPGGRFEATHQLNSSANRAHLPQKWAKLAVLSSSKTNPRILIFSIVLDAEYSFYVNSIATDALPLHF